MADNKQYIYQADENGCVSISEDVVATIALHSLSDIEGFVGLSTKPNGELTDLLNAKHWGKGIRVTITEKGALVLECNVLIAYGASVVQVAKSIQETVAAAVSSTTGATVKHVNVNVCGIVRK